MQLGFVIALILVGAASAQTPEDGLRSQIKSVRYFPLAEQARIQGDVRLSVKAGVVTLLAGHSLLARIAVESAKAFASIQSEMDLEMTYHFVLVDTTTSVPTSITVPRGDAFERAILRMFGRKTVKVVLDYRCEQRDPPANDLTVVGASVEVWIFGRTPCLTTSAATLVAQRLRNHSAAKD